MKTQSHNEPKKVSFWPFLSFPPYLSLPRLSSSLRPSSPPPFFPSLCTVSLSLSLSMASFLSSTSLSLYDVFLSITSHSLYSVSLYCLSPPPPAKALRPSKDASSAFHRETRRRGGDAAKGRARVVLSGRVWLGYFLKRGHKGQGSRESRRDLTWSIGTW